MDIQPIIVYRDPDFYSTFPDVKRLPDGRILCVFRQAPYPETRITHIEPGAGAVAVLSDDGGRTWSSPETIYRDGRCLNDPSVQVLRDGRLLLNFFFWVGIAERDYSPETSPYGRRVDHGEWGVYAEPGGTYLLWGQAENLRWEPAPLHALGTNTFLIATSASVLETASGALLLPVYGRSPELPVDRAFILRSEDGGKTWQEPTLMAEPPRGRIPMHEPALAQNTDGLIIGLIRTADAGDRLYAVHSMDDGLTWTTPEETPLIGHPADLELLPDGRMLAVYGYRHDPGWGVRGCISQDGGLTWAPEDVFVIADHGAHRDLGYPSVCRTDDDHILVAYYMNGPDTRDRWIECKRIPLEMLRQ